MRRGKTIKNKLKNFKILFNNVRGIKSKVKSLQDVVMETQPTVICLVETHLQKDEILEIEGYEIIRNDRQQQGGGVLIAYKSELHHIIKEVNRESVNGETIWIKIDNNKQRIRLAVVYAPQERRSERTKIKQMYDNIENEIIKANENNEKVLIIGDMNCKIGTKIAGNKSKVSMAGKIMNTMMEKHNLTPINSNSKCEGLWTIENKATVNQL